MHIETTKNLFNVTALIEGIYNLLDFSTSNHFHASDFFLAALKFVILIPCT
jgi:hypothetical protein